MAKQCAETIQMEDRESAELIWKFLELVIKQNGVRLLSEIRYQTKWGTFIK